MVCIDYSSHPVALGELSWVIIDFWGDLTLGDKLRNALSEGGDGTEPVCRVTPCIRL